MEQNRPLEQIERLDWNLFIERFTLAIVVDYQVFVNMVGQEIVEESYQV